MLSRVGLWSSRTRFLVACAVGGFAAAAVFSWFVFLGSGDVFAPDMFSNFYDAQAHSLLGGHWDMPAKVLAFERYNIDGRYFMYFGPWPALLRMPVAVFTGEMDGRLSRVSMLLAFVVFLVFVSRVAWQARILVRGDGQPSRLALFGAGGFVFVAGCASSALFLASRVWVYHEGILWGIAWSVAAFSFLISYLVSGRGRDLGWVGLTATLAMLSRASVGLGPVLALGAILAVHLAQRVVAWLLRRRSRPPLARRLALARWAGVSDEVLARSSWPIALAAGIPLALYMYVNYSKFGTLFSLPVDKQDIRLGAPERRAALAASNQLFSIDYAPTNLLQYFRPDAIGIDRLFPWITFSPSHTMGLAYDHVEPTASITAVSAVLLVLAILGVVAAIRAAHPAAVPTTGSGTEPKPGAETLRIPLLCATAAAAGVTVIAELAQRYQSDFVPLLVIGAAAGLAWLPALLVHRAALTRRFIVVAIVMLAVWSCGVTAALTLRYQRTQQSGFRRDFVDFQLDVNDVLGLGGAGDIRQGPRLPEQPAPLGQFFIAGDCSDLYLSDGWEWLPVEEQRDRWRVVFGSPAPGTREPLWSASASPYSRTVLWVRWLDDRHVRFEYQGLGVYPKTFSSKVIRVEPGRSYDFDVRLDPTVDYAEIKHRDRVLLSKFYEVPNVRPALGSQDLSIGDATTFAGSIHSVDREPNPICRRLQAQHAARASEPNPNSRQLGTVSRAATIGNIARPGRGAIHLAPAVPTQP